MNEIRKLIAKGRTLDAINKAIEFTKSKNNYHIDDLILLSSKKNELDRASRLGIISKEELNLESSKISYGLLQVVTNLEKEIEKPIIWKSTELKKNQWTKKMFLFLGAIIILLLLIVFHSSSSKRDIEKEKKQVLQSQKNKTEIVNKKIDSVIADIKRNEDFLSSSKEQKNQDNNSISYIKETETDQQKETEKTVKALTQIKNSVNEFTNQKKEAIKENNLSEAFRITNEIHKIPKSEKFQKIEDFVNKKYGETSFLRNEITSVGDNIQYLSDTKQFNEIEYGELSMTEFLRKKDEFGSKIFIGTRNDSTFAFLIERRNVAPYNHNELIVRVLYPRQMLILNHEVFIEKIN